MVDGEQPLQRKRLRPEEVSGDCAVFGGAVVGGECGAAAALAAFGEGGLGEEGCVVFGGVVGGEVGGYEEMGGVVGEGVGEVCCFVGYVSRSIVRRGGGGGGV